MGGGRAFGLIGPIPSAGVGGGSFFPTCSLPDGEDMSSTPWMSLYSISYSLLHKVMLILPKDRIPQLLFVHIHLLELGFDRVGVGTSPQSIGNFGLFTPRSSRGLWEISQHLPAYNLATCSISGPCGSVTDGNITSFHLYSCSVQWKGTGRVSAIALLS